MTSFASLFVSWNSFFFFFSEILDSILSNVMRGIYYKPHSFARLAFATKLKNIFTLCIQKLPLPKTCYHVDIFWQSTTFPITGVSMPFGSWNFVSEPTSNTYQQRKTNCFPSLCFPFLFAVVGSFSFSFPFMLKYIKKSRVKRRFYSFSAFFEISHLI